MSIQITPVSLNEDEKTFVDYLNEYVEENEVALLDKSIYLLRNKSKVGMGFFDAGNFYPDYILWIDTADKQYISFIDPKGLMRIFPNDPKIEFYKTIKKLEQQLAPTATDKPIILNSFIMSATKSGDLREWWHMDRADRESRNVYTLDDNECVAKMFDKILSE